MEDSQGVGLRGIVDVGENLDGRLEAFATGTDSALWHIWQDTRGGAWSNWASLAGVLTHDRAVGRNADGRLEVFVRGTDDALWHIWQLTPGGAWSGWALLGGVITEDPFVNQNLDGRLEVFACGTDQALWHIWQTAPNGGWSSWSSLRGVVTTDPVVAQNNDGRLEVFARGTDIALWHIWQVSAGGGWSAWASLAGVITSIPSVGRNADGRLEAFVCGTDNALWHIWQDLKGAGGWSGWVSYVFLPFLPGFGLFCPYCFRSTAFSKIALMAADFSSVFATLTPILAQHSKRLTVKADTPIEYTVLTKAPSPYPQHKGQPMYFGSVRLGKAYVSFHLMPLYMTPELTNTIAPALKKRMQGKTCFNFKTDPEPELVAELKRLTAAGVAMWSEKKWL